MIKNKQSVSSFKSKPIAFKGKAKIPIKIGTVRWKSLKMENFFFVTVEMITLEAFRL